MYQSLQHNLPSFLDDAFAYIAELGLDIAGLPIDHIALRYKNSADVDRLVVELNEQGVVIADATVNGRIIYIFKLHKQLIYKNYQIPCVELPYPATDHKYPKDGWEHIEFVLPSDNLDNFEQVFNQRFPGQKYELHIPDVKGEALLNPTVVLTKYPGLSVKFHPNSIAKVVAS